MHRQLSSLKEELGNTSKDCPCGKRNLLKVDCWSRMHSVVFSDRLMGHVVPSQAFIGLLVNFNMEFWEMGLGNMNSPMTKNIFFLIALDRNNFYVKINRRD